MRILNANIPSTFQDFDTNSNAADSFANVRDQQVYRENHNALVAQRIRRPVYTMQFRTAAVSTYVSFWDTGPDTVGDMPILCSGTVPVSQHTKELTLKVRASTAGASGDANLYPVMTSAGASLTVDTTNSINVTGSSEAAYSVDIPLPPVALAMNRHGYRWYDFRLFAQTNIAVSSIKGATAINDSGPDWIETSAAISATADFWMFITTDATISPRWAIDYQALSGGAYRYRLSRPWNKIPIPGTDTADGYDPYAIELYSLSLYEKPVTGFFNTVGAF
jgi:hypothetical protein